MLGKYGSDLNFAGLWWPVQEQFSKLCKDLNTDVQISKRIYKADMNIHSFVHNFWTALSVSVY